MSILSKMLRIAGRGDDGNAKAIATNNDGVLKTELTGSYSILSTETKPTGNENESLLEYNVGTGETKVFKFISGEWREL